MSNRPRNAVKWSEAVQAMVSQTTKEKLKVLSEEAGTTISGLCREILDDHVKEDQTSKSC